MIPTTEHLSIVEETKASIKADATSRAKQMIEEAKEQWRQEGKGYAERQRQKLTQQYEEELVFLRYVLVISLLPRCLNRWRVILTQNPTRVVRSGNTHVIMIRHP